jgi:hypothetical protein
LKLLINNYLENLKKISKKSLYFEKDFIEMGDISEKIRNFFVLAEKSK